MRWRRGAVASMNRVMKMATRPPAVMPFCQQPAREIGQQVGEYQAVLAADADPEGDACDEPLAVVDAALHDLRHAADEAHGQHHRQIGHGDGAGYGQDRRRPAWAGTPARPGGPRPRLPRRAGRDPRQLDGGDADPDGLGGHDAGDAGQQLADAVGGHRPLHRPVVHRPRPPPRHPLDGDGPGDGLDGPDDGHEHEGGKQPPRTPAPDRARRPATPPAAGRSTAPPVTRPGS